jgi:arylsulfatase A-like enzyme
MRKAGIELHAALAVALTVLLLAGCSPESAPPRPARGVDRLILVTIDTLRADHVGSIGYSRETTPNIDRLALESALFTQAIAQSSWTRASMASVMTGLYPTTLGLTCHNFRLPKKHCDLLPQAAVTLAEVLQEQGLRTASIVANINVDAVFGFDQGFSELQVVAADLAADDPEWRVHDEWFDRTTREVTDRALEWLEAHGTDDRGFLLNLHYLDPHHPYDPPEPHRGMFDPANDSGDPRSRDARALYDGEIRHVDEQFRRVLDWISVAGLDSRTMIVILSDHGEEFHDHGGLLHGFTMYDEQIRVPLLLRVPGITDAGRVVDQQVRLIDLMPTLLELLGAPRPDGGAGISLVPLLHGESIVEAPALSEWGYRSLVSWRAPPWKLIYDIDSGESMLFRLDDDPRELNDLSAEEPDRVARLTRAMTEALAAAIASREGLAVEEGNVELAAEQVEQLRALGYVDGM